MSAPAPADRVQLAGAEPPPPPPDQVPLVQQIAAVLLAGLTLEATIKALAALLKPFRISRTAVRATLGLIDTAHTPRSVLKAAGLDRRSPAADIARRAATQDAYYRAAYLAKASGRVQRELDTGHSLRDALRAEVANFAAHKAAREKRLNAAGRTASASKLYGNLLGWYRNPMLDSDADCRVADGNNFRADEGTVIGWPGAVHPHCGCHAGPAHEDGAMVNDVLGDVLGRMSPSAAASRVLKLRRQPG